MLLRHRAVLFGVLGGACLAAAFRPEWAGPVMGCALVSTASFVVLGGSSPGLRRIVWVDGVLSLLLVVGLAVG